MRVHEVGARWGASPRAALGETGLCVVTAEAAGTWSAVWTCEKRCVRRRGQSSRGAEQKASQIQRRFASEAGAQRPGGNRAASKAVGSRARAGGLTGLPSLSRAQSYSFQNCHVVCSSCEQAFLMYRALGHPLPSTCPTSSTEERKGILSQPQTLRRRRMASGGGHAAPSDHPPPDVNSAVWEDIINNHLKFLKRGQKQTDLEVGGHWEEGTVQVPS